MPPLAIFGISVGVNFVVRGIIAAQYLWPALRNLQRAQAPRPLLLFFTICGSSARPTWCPGLSPRTCRTRSHARRHTDLIAARLALLALAGLPSRLGIGLV